MSRLHADIIVMMSFLQMMTSVDFIVCSPENKHGGGRTMKLHEFKEKTCQTELYNKVLPPLKYLENNTWMCGNMKFII